MYWLTFILPWRVWQNKSPQLYFLIVCISVAECNFCLAWHPWFCLSRISRARRGVQSGAFCCRPPDRSNFGTERIENFLSPLPIHFNLKPSCCNTWQTTAMHAASQQRHMCGCDMGLGGGSVEGQAHSRVKDGPWVEWANFPFWTHWIEIEEFWQVIRKLYGCNLQVLV